MAQYTEALDAHAFDHILHELAPEPELGYVVQDVWQEVLHAILVVPRTSIQQRLELEPILLRHPNAVAWVAPQSTSRTGNTWRGRGWFPLTHDEWLRLRDANRHQVFLSDCSAMKKRQRDLVNALYGMLKDALAL